MTDLTVEDFERIEQLEELIEELKKEAKENTINPSQRVLSFSALDNKEFILKYEYDSYFKKLFSVYPNTSDLIIKMTNGANVSIIADMLICGCKTEEGNRITVKEVDIVLDPKNLTNIFSLNNFIKRVFAFDTSFVEQQIKNIELQIKEIRGEKLSEGKF